MSHFSNLPVIRTTAVLLAAASLGFHIPASAQEFCSEPVAPYCIDEDTEFDSLVQINRCIEDVNDYEEQLGEYEQCITSQLEGMRNDLSAARKKIEEAEKNF